MIRLICESDAPNKMNVWKMKNCDSKFKRALRQLPWVVLSLMKRYGNLMRTPFSKNELDFSFGQYFSRIGN